jgi:nucleoside-diphosphate-sugar epimerase
VTGRRYVVTGSASGIGAATAAILRDQGATVIGCDLDDADIVADVSTPAGRRALVDQVGRCGPIDAVLAVAGGGRTGLLETNYFGTVATLEGLRRARSPCPRRPHSPPRTNASCAPVPREMRPPRPRWSPPIRRSATPRTGSPSGP